jgi:predicted ATPase
MKAIDDPATLTTKEGQRLQQVGLEADAILPYLLHLLGLPVATERLAGLSAEALKARTVEALLQMFLGHGQQQPMALAVESLHWIDPSSEALLTALIEGLGGTSLLLLVTFRPGYRPPWLDKSYVTQIALQPLGQEASRQVVRSVLRETALTPELEQHILAKAEGNPFFLEELAHTVAEQEGHTPVLTVPETIQTVIAARLDRLPVEEKTLLQVAAVIGMDLPFSLLHSLSGLSEDTLRHRLTHLQAAEFLYETRFAPERVYTFKHVLTQEAAYNSLIQEQRRALHVRVAEALIRLVPEQSPDRLTRLAQHALLGEQWRTAAQALQQAGTRALARSAYQEAVTCFTQAMEALRHLPEPERLETTEQMIDLLFGLRGALLQLGELDRALAALHEAEALAQSLNDPHRLGRVSSYMARHCFLLGEHDVALAAGQRALALATQFPDLPLQVAGRMYLGQVYHALGEYTRAIDVLQQNVVALTGDLSGAYFGLANLPVVTSRTFLVYSLAELGRFDEGSACGAEGIRLAETAEHANSLAIAYLGAGRLALNQGNFSQAIAVLNRALTLCRSAHIALLFPAVATALGYAYTLTGDMAEALPLFEQVQETAPLPTPLSSLVLVWLAEIVWHMGRLAEAQGLAERAYKLSLDRQERGNQAWALRLLGTLAASEPALDTLRVEDHYEQALALADELGMRPLLAQCQFGLGTLYSRLGRREAARRALTTAITLLRTMAMPFWLTQAEAALAQID